MFLFTVRRLLISIPILVASSFVVFGLVTISGDPLDDLRESQNPNREQLIASRRQALHLDQPVPARYVTWAKGVVTGDFGKNKSNQDVAPILKQAMVTTLRLVVLATALSVLLGLAVGILSAVRQYSLFDYSATFGAFLFYALPVFWLAVLLKQFGAIKLNNWFVNPSVSVLGVVLLAVLTAFFWSAAIGGTRRRRLLVAGAAGGGSAALLVALESSHWFDNPGLSLPMVILLSAGGAAVATLLFGRLANRRVVVPALVAAAVALLITLVLSSWVQEPNWSRLALITVLSIGGGLAAGAALGGIDRRAAMSAGVTAAVFVGLVVLVDEFLSAWKPGRTIATVGPQTPNLKGTFWRRMIDYAGHQVLPSIALALIGFALYSRFTRASMLETMNSDFVRTARAKGLPAGRVILRHGFRTALIPVTTVIAISFGTIIEGAVITENVFAWKGMGSLFREGLLTVDPYPVMGFLIITSVIIVLFNALADIMYAYLDPRIRLD